MSRKGSDDSSRAREIFERFSDHMENASNRGIAWERCGPSTVTGETDGVLNEVTVQRHLISSVEFRWIDGDSEDEWELQSIWDNVSVRQLDDIGQKPICEWHSRNYSGQKNIKVAMAENVNVVLLRMILDWSRQDGNVLSEQVVWSGSFADCHRVLQLLENDSNTANFIELRVERFDLNIQFREQYLALHESYPVAAANAAVDCSQTVPKSIVIDDGEGDICPICHDTLSTGAETKLLPCSHLFHWNCILEWFISKFECPLCRKKFRL